ncbi:nucleophile aminohydrolase [Vibrio phage 1.193.O._10N.286.52.C6]|nr:nucleophile aminohydrolase [Vibrio phage 1.193.O._10N.286.52.C6]
MTTITYRAGVMCSDSQATRGDFIDNKNTTKVYEVGGSLIGISGNAISAKKFVDWFADMTEHSTAQEAFPHVNVTLPEKLVEEDFHALVVYPDQTAYEFFGCDNVIECSEEYAAVGSGMLYALCAMDAGADAEEAVKVAIKRDVYSGGEIQKFTLELEEELTEEDIRAMSHEDLLKLVLGGDVGEEEVTILTSEPAAEDIIINKSLDRIHSEILENDGMESITDFVKITPCESSLHCLAVHYEIKFAHNIGIEKLRQRILDFLNEED